MSTDPDRGAFLTSAFAAAALAAQGTPAAVADEPRRLTGRALVLSGGGALGAYEAGVVAALADRHGLRDGMPLPYSLVCGTSIIGALNAYAVATAQYSRLRQAWETIAQLDVVRIKPRYAKIAAPWSGIFTRLFEVFALGFGLAKNIRGVLDGAAVNAFFDGFVDLADDVHIPLYVASTNLSRLRAEIFVRRATTPAGMESQTRNDALLNGASDIIVRVAADDLIRKALFASAAIPLAYDPVTFISPEGSTDEYVDGGITSNVPLGIARRCAAVLDVVLVQPAFASRTATYRDASEIGLGVFDTMQRRLLELQVGLAYAARGSATDFPVNVIRPMTALTGSILSFNDARAIASMWQRGYADGTTGFSAYVPAADSIL